jgi:hypothetical protein
MSDHDVEVEEIGGFEILSKGAGDEIYPDGESMEDYFWEGAQAIEAAETGELGEQIQYGLGDVGGGESEQLEDEQQEEQREQEQQQQQEKTRKAERSTVLEVGDYLFAKWEQEILGVTIIKVHEGDVYDIRYDDGYIVRKADRSVFVRNHNPKGKRKRTSNTEDKLKRKQLWDLQSYSAEDLWGSHQWQQQLIPKERGFMRRGEVETGIMDFPEPKAFQAAAKRKKRPKNSKQSKPKRIVTEVYTEVYDPADFLNAPAASLVANAVRVNTNAAGGTAMFKHMLEQAQSLVAPSLALRIQQCLDGFKGNSAGVTKDKLELLLPHELRNRRRHQRCAIKGGGTKGGGTRLRSPTKGPSLCDTYSTVNMYNTVWASLGFRPARKNSEPPSLWRQQQEQNKKNSQTGTWTEEENQQLLEAVKTCGTMWNNIEKLQLVPTRSGVQCRQRWNRSLFNGFKGGVQLPGVVPIATIPKKKVSGFYGVYTDGISWKAVVASDGKSRLLGAFNTREEAQGVLEKEQEAAQEREAALALGQEAALGSSNNTALGSSNNNAVSTPVQLHQIGAQSNECSSATTSTQSVNPTSTPTNTTIAFDSSEEAISDGRLVSDESISVEKRTSGTNAPKGTCSISVENPSMYPSVWTALGFVDSKSHRQHQHQLNPVPEPPVSAPAGGSPAKPTHPLLSARFGAPAASKAEEPNTDAAKPVRTKVKAKHRATERLHAMFNGGTLKDGDKVFYQHYDTQNKRAQFVAIHLAFRCLGSCCCSDPTAHHLFDVNELEDHWGR